MTISIEISDEKLQRVMDAHHVTTVGELTESVKGRIVARVVEHETQLAADSARQQAAAEVGDFEL